MCYRREYLELDDEALKKECDIHTYKASGPGGQHRNKVSSAIRLKHRPTGISAHGDDSRSQHENRRLALTRLRMNIACRRRVPFPESGVCLPPVVQGCLFTPKLRKGQNEPAAKRLEIGRKDHRFWLVAAFLLDVMEHTEGRLAEAADQIGISTGNLSSLLKSDRHLLAAAQELRKRHHQHPLQ